MGFEGAGRKGKKERGGRCGGGGVWAEQKRTKKQLKKPRTLSLFFSPDLQGPCPQDAGPLVLREVPRRDPLAVGALPRGLLLRRRVGHDLDLGAGGSSPGACACSAAVVAVLALPASVEVLNFRDRNCVFFGVEESTSDDTLVDRSADMRHSLWISLACERERIGGECDKKRNERASCIGALMASEEKKTQ